MTTKYTVEIEVNEVDSVGYVNDTWWNEVGSFGNIDHARRFVEDVIKETVATYRILEIVQNSRNQKHVYLVQTNAK